MPHKVSERPPSPVPAGVPARARERRFGSALARTVAGRPRGGGLASPGWLPSEACAAVPDARPVVADRIGLWRRPGGRRPQPITDDRPGGRPPQPIADDRPGGHPPQPIADDRPSGHPPQPIADDRPSGHPPQRAADNRPSGHPPRRSLTTARRLPTAANLWQITAGPPQQLAKERASPLVIAVAGLTVAAASDRGARQPPG